MPWNYSIKSLLLFFFITWNFYPANPNTSPIPPIHLNDNARVENQIKSYLDSGAKFMYKPESFKADMDSAKSNFNKAFILSNKIQNQDLIHKCMFYYGEILFEEENYPKAIKTFQNVILYYHENKQFEKEAKVLDVMGQRLFWHSPRSFETLEESIKSFNKAAHLYRILGLQKELAYSIKCKADAHLNQGRLDLAEKELLEAVRIYKKSGYKKLHFTYDLLADLQRLKGDLGKSLYYSLACVKSMEETKDFRYAALFYQQLAVAYKDLGKHELSIELLRKVLTDFKLQKIIDTTDLYDFIDLLSKEMIQVKQHKEALYQVQKIIKEYPPVKHRDKARMYGSLAYCYNKNNQIKLAEANYIKAINLFEENTSTMYIIDLSIAYFELGKFYEEHKKYDNAKINFQKSLNFSNGIVELSQIKEANLYLFKIDSIKGNYITAIKYFQRYKNLNDSIFNEKKNKQIEELQVLYDVEKKEKAFSNLKLAMDAEKGKITQANSTIKYGLGIVTLLLLSTILFWRSYQSKQKNNKLLMYQKNEIDLKNNALQKLVEEKESLMQEIHHRVKNNLQIVMSLLNSQSSTLKSQEAFDAIQKSQNRLYAISLLHKKLYKTDIVRQIEMENYINDLLCNFKDTFDLQDRINFEVDVNSIFLDESQGVSVGLILNETVTNAIKHAFPENQKGTIFILMKELEHNKIIFQIKDNGIGFQEDFNLKTETTLGLNLIKGLAQQLDGEVSFLNENGVKVQIEFIKSPVL